MKMRKLLTVTATVGLLFFSQISAVFAAPVNDRCKWSLNPDIGKLTYCAGGFDSIDDLKRSKVKLWCGGPDCGSILERARLAILGGDHQMVPFSDFTEFAQDANGKYYTCFTGDFDQSVKGAIDAYINRKNAACATVMGAGALLGGGVLSGGVLVTIGVTAGTTAGGVSCFNMFNDFHPEIYGTLIDQNGAEVCQHMVRISAEVTEANNEGNLNPNDLPDASQLGLNPAVFSLCKQIPEGDKRQACYDCSAGKDGEVNGVWTAVGCVPTSQESIVGAILKIGLGLSGGFALLLIITAGFMISTAQGNVKRVDEAKELFTSAIMGLVFIIFSVTILQFIGVQILRIPGFGN